MNVANEKDYLYRYQLFCMTSEWPNGVSPRCKSCKQSCTQYVVLQYNYCATALKNLAAQSFRLDFFDENENMAFFVLTENSVRHTPPNIRIPAWSEIFDS